MNTKEIQNIVRGEVLEDEPLSRHTSFRTGGPADIFVLPRDSAELAGLIEYLRAEGSPYYVLGNGTNVLASDEGFRGVVISIGKDMGGIELVAESDRVRVRAGAGCLINEIGMAAARMGAGGLEALTGIPGSVGGAVIMNAGAFGSEIKDVLLSVTVLDSLGKVRDIGAEEAGLRYRGSVLMDEGLIVTEVEMELTPSDKARVMADTEELLRRRREKQPLEYPSAGSTFKRPQGYYAGKLIADAGLKGLSVGGAQVSEKHAGFIINKGSASSDDIFRLIQSVRARVLDRYGVELQPEVRFLGDFPGPREGGCDAIQ